jgi:hypothetical protein
MSRYLVLPRRVSGFGVFGLGSRDLVVHGSVVKLGVCNLSIWV